MSKIMSTLNGYEIVDDYARTQIENIETNIGDLSEQIDNLKESGTGATEEQLAQIEQNKTDIQTLQNDVYTEESERKAEIAVERERINSFTRLAEGSTTGDAELIDARVDYKGITHANVGEHIRTVSNQHSEQIETNNKNIITIDNSVEALNNVVFVTQSEKTKMYSTKNLVGNSVSVTADNDCEITCKGKNLFFGDRTYMQQGITKRAYGNVIHFEGTTTTAITTIVADISCFIPKGKVYIVVDCDKQLGALSLRKSDFSALSWLTNNTVAGQVYMTELEEPAYYFRIDLPLVVDEGFELDDTYKVAVYVGFEPLAGGEDIPNAQQTKVNVIANTNVQCPIFTDGYIYTEDETEFSVFGRGTPQRNLYEINNEINALKAQMPVFMRVSDFNKSADMVNNESTIVLLS